MATYFVTTSNWNDPAFWSGLFPSDEDTLDLSALGSSYTLDFDGPGNTMTISDGATSFTVNAANGPSGDANLGGGNVHFFDYLILPDGPSSMQLGDSKQSVQGGDGHDSIHAGDGADTVDGGGGDDTIDAGDGDDFVEGGAGDDVFVYSVGDGADTITDFNAGNTGSLDDGDSTNNDFIDLTAFYTDLVELRADFDDDGILNQSNDSVDGADYSDNTRFGSGNSLTFSGSNVSSFTQDNTGVICFAAETMIQTPGGQVAADAIKIGDLVDTLDNGPQRVRWIGRREIGRAELLANPRLLPIRVKPGVLGNTRALIVSRQHGLLWGRHGTQLVRAGKLSKTRQGFHIARDRKDITYVHLMFGRHQIVFAEGVPAESFFPGKIALSSLNQISRQSFERHFGAVTSFQANPCEIVETFGPAARPFASNIAAVG